MSNMLQPILAELDPKIVYIAVIILVVVVVLSILKKALKIALTVGIIAVCIFLLAPMAKDFQENYKFEIVENEMHITSDGKEYVVGDLSKVKNVEMSYNGKQEIDITISYTDGTMSLTVPAFMGEGIKAFLEKFDVQYKVI